MCWLQPGTYTVEEGMEVKVKNLINIAENFPGLVFQNKQTKKKKTKLRESNQTKILLR